MADRGRKKSGLTGALGLALLVSGVAAGDGGWTDNVQSKEGLFAFRADAAAHRVLVFRADSRAEPPGRLYRIRLSRDGKADLVAPLRQAGADGPPWKLGAVVAGWDGAADAAALEVSDDGKLWRSIGRFRRHGDGE